MQAIAPDRIVLRMDEQPLRWTGPGRRATVSVHLPRDREMLAVIAFEPVRGAQLADLRIEVDGVRVPGTVREDLVPPCIVATLPAREGPPRATELGLTLRGTGPADGADARLVSSISLIPAQPFLKEKFPRTRLQRLKRRLGLAPRDRGDGDFPLSHFDGLGYLKAYPEIEEAVRSGRIPSALEHYIRQGRAEGRRYLLAGRGLPNAGTLEELIRPEFDGLAYALKNPDIGWGVRHNVVPSALHHYVHSGLREGRALTRAENASDAKSGDFYDLFVEELLLHKQQIWKGFEEAMATRRHEVEYELGVLRSELETARTQIDALKAVVAGAAARSRIARPRLYIDVQHGLGNRLKSFVSASVLAEKVGRELVLVWVPDHHCQCQFSDLFEHEGPVVSEPGGIDRERVRVYNYMEIEPGARKDERIDLDTPADIYVRSAYPLNTLLTDWNAENRLLRSLRVTAPVRDLVDSIDVTGRLGVHIRMEGGAGLDAHSYDSGANWSPASHQALADWRSKSHYSSFMRRIDALSREEPGLRLFLATDMDETYRIFQEAYGDRLAFLRRPVFDRSREQLIYALADAILLGRCERFLGSTYSTFSELAIRYSTGFRSVEMSGKDF